MQGLLTIRRSIAGNSLPIVAQQQELDRASNHQARDDPAAFGDGIADAGRDLVKVESKEIPSIVLILIIRLPLLPAS
jgi:hypothetical protein